MYALLEGLDIRAKMGMIWLIKRTRFAILYLETIYREKTDLPFQLVPRACPTLELLAHNKWSRFPEMYG